MSGYDNELSGALFKNDNQRVGKKDPDYKGTVTVGGVEYWVSSWLNVAKDGRKYLSLKLKAKESKAAPVKVAAPQEDFNDDITF